jgi:septal ring factor EnvC (AmiA/AmiB activator)
VRESDVPPSPYDVADVIHHDRRPWWAGSNGCIRHPTDVLADWVPSGDKSDNSKSEQVRASQSKSEQVREQVRASQSKSEQVREQVRASQSKSEQVREQVRASQSKSEQVRASQSKSKLVKASQAMYGSRTLSALAALGAVDSPH